MSATPHQVQISGQIQLADLDALKAAGIGTVINNRPDGEAPDQPSSEAVAAKAAELGMKYFYVPVSPRGLTEDNLEKMAEALEASEGEVFAYCRTGNRTGVLLTAVSQSDR